MKSRRKISRKACESVMVLKIRELDGLMDVKHTQAGAMGMQIIGFPRSCLLNYEKWIHFLCGHKHSDFSFYQYKHCDLDTVENLYLFFQFALNSNWCLIATFRILIPQKKAWRISQHFFIIFVKKDQRIDRRLKQKALFLKNSCFILGLRTDLADCRPYQRIWFNDSFEPKCVQWIV